MNLDATGRLALLVGGLSGALAAPPAQAADACLPPGIALIDVRVEGALLSFCTPDDAARAKLCWQIDLAAAPPRWSTLPSAPTVPATAPPEPPSAGAVRACTAAGAPCIDFVPPAPVPADDYVRAALSPDGSVVATWSGGPMTFYDVATKKVRFAVKAWKTPMGNPSFFQGVQFLGSAVAIYISFTPVSSAARLFDAKNGRAIGAVGPRGTELDDCTPLQLTGDRWVFPTFMAERLVIQNVRTGKVLRSIKAADGPPMVGAQQLARLPDGRMLLVPYTPDIPLILADPQNGTTTRLAFPLCAPEPPQTPAPTLPR